MIALTALALLAAVTLLLNHPDSTIAATLRRAAGDHPRAVLGIATLTAVCIVMGALWSSDNDRETDVQGYGELWHMVQTAPQLREPARTRLGDGRITDHELEELREMYRDAPDVETMRDGVVKELSR